MLPTPIFSVEQQTRKTDQRPPSNSYLLVLAFFNTGHLGCWYAGNNLGWP